MDIDPKGKPARIAVAFAVMIAWSAPTEAQDAASDQRPAFQLTRAEEDWSALADPALRTRPLDRLKYVGLPGGSGSYLSFGGDLRIRSAQDDAFLFDLTGAGRDHYTLVRAHLHADLRLANGLRAFLQFGHSIAPGKADPGPADVDRFDVTQGFVEYRTKTASGGYSLRVGRQEVPFGMERFVSIREGPNVRQAFDAILAQATIGRLDLRFLLGRPVEYLPGTLDDTSSSDATFHAARVEWSLGQGESLSAYLGQLYREETPAGAERRNILDLRYFRAAGPLQIDAEAMLQRGRSGGDAIDAWAIGLRGRYQLSDKGWQPKLGLQVDLASGDSDPGDDRAETFEPPFPNGSYFTQAGFTGFANLVHVKPSLTVEVLPRVSVLAAVGFQRRLTTNDSVYAQPYIPLPGTAGEGRKNTGGYGQIQVTWQATPATKVAAEFVHFNVADWIEDIGGQDSSYFAIEIQTTF